MKILPRALLLAALILPLWTSRAAEPKRVACVGDSITQGVGAEPGQSYPDQLARLLGAGWKVENYGVSAKTMIKQDGHSYWKTPQFANALASRPDIVIIMLGTNDTKPGTWANRAQFVPDYREMIAKFQALPSKPHVFICLPCPVVGEGNFGINAAGIAEEIPWITELAAEMKAGLIDIHGALKDHPEFLPDRVHPNTEGAGLMAKAVHEAILRGQ